MYRVLGDQKDTVRLSGRAKLLAFRHGICPVHTHAENGLHILVAAIGFALISNRIFSQNWQQVQVSRICRLLFLLARRNRNLVYILWHLILCFLLHPFLVAGFDHHLRHAAVAVHGIGTPSANSHSYDCRSDQRIADARPMFLPPVFFSHHIIPDFNYCSAFVFPYWP